MSKTTEAQLPCPFEDLSEVPRYDRPDDGRLISRDTQNFCNIISELEIPDLSIVYECLERVLNDKSEQPGLTADEKFLVNAHIRLAAYAARASCGTGVKQQFRGPHMRYQLDRLKGMPVDFDTRLSICMDELVSSTLRLRSKSVLEVSLV